MCWFHHAITDRHSSPSAPVVSRRKRCRSELPKFLSRASLFASMTCVLRLSDGAVVCQLSTRPEHLTLIGASPFLAADYSWGVFHTSARQRQFSVILIGSLPRW